MIICSLVLTIICFCILNNEKFSKYGNILRVFYETYTSQSKNQIHPEIENINETSTIRFAECYMPTFESLNHYDITCNFGEETVPFTHFKKHNLIGYIPFRPKDFKYKTLTVKVRKITEDKFEEFTVKETEYIDLQKIVTEYEEKLKNTTHTLAEAYD